MDFLEISHSFYPLTPDRTPPKILVIAGWDPTAGAGIAADLKVTNQLHCYACAVTTALTVQNKSGLKEIFPVPPDNFQRQLSALLQESKFSVWKLGLLGSKKQIEIISRFIRQYPPKHLIIDPVISATFGGELTPAELRETILEKLFPLRPIVTPNSTEAKVITSYTEKTLQNNYLKVAEKLIKMGPKAAIITGIQIKEITNSKEIISTGDLLYTHTKKALLTSPKIAISGEAHGTGCTYASALSAFLAHDYPLIKAAKMAKAYLLFLLETFSQIEPLPANSLQHLPFYNWRDYAKKIKITEPKIPKKNQNLEEKIQ